MSREIEKLKARANIDSCALLSFGLLFSVATFFIVVYLCWSVVIASIFAGAVDQGLIPATLTFKQVLLIYAFRVLRRLQLHLSSHIIDTAKEGLNDD